MELRNDFLRERSVFLPACRTLGTNLYSWKKEKGKQRKRNKIKKRKKEEISTDYPACHFDVASSPFKCHFGALMWACDTLTEIFS